MMKKSKGQTFSYLCRESSLEKQGVKRASLQARGCRQGEKAFFQHPVKNYFYLSLFAFFLLPLQVGAQNSLVHPWAVGQSITLQSKLIINGQTQSTRTTTYSIVDEETVKGKKYFWIEIEETGQSGLTLLRKLQVRQPQAIDFSNLLDGRWEKALKVRRKILGTSRKDSKGPSPLVEFEMPATLVSEVENAPDFSLTSDLTGQQYEVTQNQSITVPAGTFIATKYSNGKTPSTTPAVSNSATVTAGEPSEITNIVSGKNESWWSSRVPIFGIIKMTNQVKVSDGENYNQQTEVLSYRDSGAAPKIKVTPGVIPIKTQEQMGKAFRSTPTQSQP